MKFNAKNTHKKIDEIDLKELLLKILTKWYVFVVVGAIALGIAIYVILSTAPIYSTKGTLLIESGNDMMSMAAEQTFIPAELLSGSKNVQDKIIVLESKSLTKQMVIDLDLQESCIYKKRFGAEYELYKNSPIEIIYPKNFKTSLQGSFQVKIHKQKDGSWNVNFLHQIGYEKTRHKDIISDISKPINTPWGNFKFKEHKNFIDKKYPNYELEFLLLPLKSRIEEYNQQIKISLSSNKANAINISIESGNIQKNEAIVNKIIELYQKDTYTDKQLNSIELGNFINERIEILDKELAIIEHKVEEFRLNKNLANIEIQSRNAIEAARDYEKLLTEVDMEYTLMTFIEDYIKQSDLLDLIPSNTGISDNTLSNLIISYNYEVMEYLRLTRSTNENNPYISQLKEKILLSRENILQTITNMKEGSMLRRENIVEKNKEIDLIINNVPTLEREYIEVAREQEIKRNLYLFLLQKREETQLAMSSATDSGKIIDYAYTAEAPVAPNKKIIIAIALFLSILLSLIYIYIESLFNKKIKKQKEIERLTQTPIIGSIPYNNIEENNQNIFRNLRSNLLLFNKDREEAKIILITSSSQQEGKSLIAINLAQSFAKSNKKTILIDLNTQNPIIAQKLQLDNTIGIKDYLLKENINENNIIQHSNYDVITLGNINNNESIDLLSNNKLKCLFDYLRKEYDQIIIDTLSLQESTDILLLNDIVDTILYVCLKNKTTRKDIKNLNNLLAKNLLNNVLIVYNENKNS